MGGQNGRKIEIFGVFFGMLFGTLFLVNFTEAGSSAAALEFLRKPRRGIKALKSLLFTRSQGSGVCNGTEGNSPGWDLEGLFSSRWRLFSIFGRILSNRALSERFFKIFYGFGGGFGRPKWWKNRNFGCFLRYAFRDFIFGKFWIDF